MVTVNIRTIIISVFLTSFQTAAKDLVNDAKVQSEIEKEEHLEIYKMAMKKKRILIIRQYTQRYLLGLRVIINHA